MIYQYQKYPELSWSFSRVKLLQECERKYYFNYYGSHNGWSFNSCDKAKRLYRLKNLKPMDALFGEVFHRNVQDTINNYDKEVVTADIFQKRLHKLLAMKYRESKKCPDKWRLYPKKHTMISEIYYESDITKDKGNRIREKIERCSDNLFKSRSFQEIISENIKLKEMEDLQHFIFNGIKVYVKLDSLFQTNNKWVIVDWKTSSKPSIDDEEQMLFYTYYVSKIQGVEPKQIEARLEYILQNDSKAYTFSKNDFEFVEAKLKNDLKIMKSYLTDEEKNISKQEEIFKQNKSRIKCSRCNYREVCFELEQETDEYGYMVGGIKE